MFVVKVYGVSCDYYLSGGVGSTLKVSEAIPFATEAEARICAGDLYVRGYIGRWEVLRKSAAEYLCGRE